MIHPEALELGIDRPPTSLRFLAGGGEATRLILERDWSDHWLGSPESWPDALKVSLSLVLNSPESMILAWGREKLSFFFNETYFPLLGPRLAWAMGSPFADVWADGWEQAKPIIDEAFAGHSRRFVDLPWKLATDRGAKDTWWTFSYSRVLDPVGNVEGLFIFTNETTDRVLADAAARASQERLRLETERQRLSLQQMPGFVGILAGATHVFQYVNDAYVAISGPRLIIGRTVREVFPELEGQGYFEELDRVYRTGQGFHARAMPLRLGDGTIQRYIDHSYQPIRDDTGAITGIFAGGYDVTDRVRAEMRREALLKLDERLRDVADTADLSFAASELLGEALGVSRVGYGTLDLQAGTITVERNWSAPGFNSLAGVHRFSDYGSYLDDLRRGLPVINADVEIDPRTATGRAAFEALGIRAFMDMVVMEQGQAVAQLFVHSAAPRAWQDEDVSLVRDFAERTRTAIARRQAEQDLRASEARLANAVASARLGTFAWNTRTGVMELDVRGREIFQLPSVGALHQDDVFGRITAGENEWVAVAAAIGAREAERVAFDCDITLPDGTTRYVRCSADATADATGERRIIGILQDLTDLKRAERTLREYNETLEARVAERTRELEVAHEQLRQSQKMEAVGQLTGGLAHDFNNLLTAITGGLELLAHRLAAGRTNGLERYINMAQSGAQRAAALTQRLLAFSRRQTLDPRPTDVDRLVADMEEIVARTLGPSIELRVSATAGLWPVLVDASQLENTLLNLCINGRDAMPDGGRLSVETANRTLDAQGAAEEDLPEGEYVCLSVADTGVGMAPDIIARVFDPFFTTKPIGEGTGLGLSMIYGFVRQSGGQIRITSEVGSGTTMQLYFPRHHGVAVPAARGASDPQRSRAETGQTVLVVEDEQAVRDLVREVLTEAGYRVLEARNGALGIALLQSDERIDLLVTDVGLPGGLNGRQVADAGRTVRRDLRVLFITGYAANAAIGGGHMDEGMSVLTKPFNTMELERRVRESISTR